MKNTEKKRINFSKLFKKDSLTVPFNDFPEPIKERIRLFVGLFIFGGLICLIFSIVLKSLSFIPFTVFILLFGAYYIGTIYTISASDKMISIEGVIIDFGITGYRRQGRCIIVRTVDGKSYRVPVSRQRFQEYQEGDIVVFYTTEADIGNKKDGVYCPERIFEIERMDLDDDAENNPKVKKAFDLLATEKEQEEPD